MCRVFELIGHSRCDPIPYARKSGTGRTLPQILSRSFEALPPFEMSNQSRGLSASNTRCAAQESSPVAAVRSIQCAGTPLAHLAGLAAGSGTPSAGPTGSGPLAGGGGHDASCDGQTKPCSRGVATSVGFLTACL